MRVVRNELCHPGSRPGAQVVQRNVSAPRLGAAPRRRLRALRGGGGHAASGGRPFEPQCRCEAAESSGGVGGATRCTGPATRHREALPARPSHPGPSAAGPRPRLQPPNRLAPCLETPLHPQEGPCNNRHEEYDPERPTNITPAESANIGDDTDEDSNPERNPCNLTGQSLGIRWPCTLHVNPPNGHPRRTFDHARGIH